MSTVKAFRPQLVGPSVSVANKTNVEANPAPDFAEKRTFRSAFRESVTCVREMPGVVRGLLELGQNYRRQMRTIFGISLLLAAWDTLLSFSLVFTVKAVSDETIAGPVLIVGFWVLLAYSIRFPAEIMLPFWRAMYTTQNFKFDLELDLLVRSLPGGGIGMTKNHPNNIDAPGVVAQNGRTAVLSLTETLLRDPAFAIRGACVFLYLLIVHPPIAGLVTLGMIIDFIVTLRMDTFVRPMRTEQQQRLQKTRSHENEALKPIDPRLSSHELEHRRHHAALVRIEGRECRDASKQAEQGSITWQTKRALLSLVITAAIVCYMAVGVKFGYYTMAELLVFTSMTIYAREPLTVFFTLQNAIMMDREIIRRYGLVTRVDFGLKPQPQTT